MNELYEGIYNEMGTSGSPTALYTAIGGRMYPVKAPQGTEFPYVVYDQITSEDELDFNAQNEIFTMQFDVFTQSDDPFSAGTIMGNLKTVYDNCDLTVTGWRSLYMVREFVVPNNDLKEDSPDSIPIMGYSIQYEIQLEKVRS